MCHLQQTAGGGQGLLISMRPRIDDKDKPHTHVLKRIPSTGAHTNAHSDGAQVDSSWGQLSHSDRQQ